MPSSRERGRGAAAPQAGTAAHRLSADRAAWTWSRPSSECRSPTPIAGSRTTSAPTPRSTPGSTRENAVTNAFLETLPARDWLKQRITQLYDYERFGRAGEEGRALFLHPQQRACRTSRCCSSATALDGEGAAADRSRTAGRRTARPRSPNGTPSDDGKLLALRDPGRRHRLAHGQGAATSPPARTCRTSSNG